MRNLLRLAVGGVLAGALVTGVLAAPAHAKHHNDYVALGDSYSSGAGGGDYYQGDCTLSHNAYPELLAAEHRLDLTFPACPGAKIEDLRADQLDDLNRKTDLVTVTIGGNDTGWGDVIATCIVGDDDTCITAIETAEEFIWRTLSVELYTLYGEIEDAAPRADILVAGYARLFAEVECADAPGLTVTEQTALNRAADQLNLVTRAAAWFQGLKYVDVQRSFTDHAVCDEEPWLNGLTPDLGEAFHPNPSGYVAYADAFGRYVR